MKDREQTKEEEFTNAIIHGIGVILSIIAMVILVFRAYHHGDSWHLVSFSIYGISLIMLYLASTIYHSFPKGKWKNIFHIIDHSSIFLLIAGTYTPFTLIPLRGPWGWSLFGAIWVIALTGIIAKTIWFDRVKALSVVLYVGMSWLVVIAIKPLIESVNNISLIFLLTGGIFYTVGIIFYRWRRQKFAHAIWHVFVLAGSILHFFGVYHLVEG